MSEFNLDAAKASGLCPTCGHEVCSCGKDVEPLPLLRERVEQERSERPERVQRLSIMVERLFAGDAHVEVRAAIRQSFDVPQWGQYHNEGMYMDTHLDRILGTINDIYNGVFPKGISEGLKTILREATKVDKDTFQRYAFLHDIEKRNTLKLKHADGTESDMDWAAWQASLPEDLREQPDPVALEVFLRAEGIQGISYYHEGVKHGDAGADTLESFGLDVDPVIVTAIRKHEVGFLFEGIQTITFGEHFASLSPQERMWAIIASYTDSMGSYQSRKPDETPSTPNVEAIEFLVASKQNFEIIEAFEQYQQADSDISSWMQRGLKQATIDQYLFKLKGKKEPLSSAEILFAAFKEDVAPKLVSGPNMGKLVKMLQQEFGKAFMPVRDVLTKLKEGASETDIRKVLASVPGCDQSKIETVLAWIKKEVLGQS